jgi:site-specific DNA-methyltransferase (adenine-specific)
MKKASVQNSTDLPVNRLILGDNLEIMKTLESESVDLIYLDPPFFSNRHYEVIWGDAGEIS